ncbi:unnamed protein product [Protopolystoma xenopodis]|uniref:EF-hand domain-containing protein n=1 Tax=Protopolystoma xenopodis TaxID=117903 RepID=A0A3S5AD08_9PLAT|nr:unnamed protein product [Protopolystoma xenopodis]
MVIMVYTAASYNSHKCSQFFRKVEPYSPNLDYSPPRCRTLVINLLTIEPSTLLFVPKVAILRQYSPIQLRRVFDKLDQDKSGKLELDELKAALKELGSGAGDSLLRSWITSVDGAASGGITFAEFVRFISQSPRQILLYPLLLPPNPGCEPFILTSASATCKLLDSQFSILATIGGTANSVFELQECSSSFFA